MLRPACICSNEWQIDVRRLSSRKLLLRLLSRLTQSLKSHRVLSKINAVALLEFSGNVIDQNFVEVVATEMCVAVR